MDARETTIMLYEMGRTDCILGKKANADLTRSCLSYADGYREAQRCGHGLRGASFGQDDTFPKYPYR